MESSDGCARENGELTLKTSVQQVSHQKQKGGERENTQVSTCPWDSQV